MQIGSGRSTEDDHKKVVANTNTDIDPKTLVAKTTKLGIDWNRITDADIAAALSYIESNSG